MEGRAANEREDEQTVQRTSKQVGTLARRLLAYRERRNIHDNGEHSRANAPGARQADERATGGQARQ